MMTSGLLLLYLKGCNIMVPDKQTMGVRMQRTKESLQGRWKVQQMLHR